MGVAPHHGRKQQTLYTKAKSTLGKPCSHFTGRETEATGTLVPQPKGRSFLLGSTCPGRAFRPSGCLSGYVSTSSTPRTSGYSSLTPSRLSWIQGHTRWLSRGTTEAGVRLVVSPKGAAGAKGSFTASSGPAPQAGLRDTAPVLDGKGTGRDCAPPAAPEPTCPRDDKCG